MANSLVPCGISEFEGSFCHLQDSDVCFRSLLKTSKLYWKPECFGGIRRGALDDLFEGQPQKRKLRERCREIKRRTVDAAGVKVTRNGVWHPAEFQRSFSHVE